MPATQTITREQEPGLYEAFDVERRRLNDIATWLAEVLPGEMRTEFQYTFNGTDLLAEDGGSMGQVFADSINKSRNLPPHLAFEYRRNLLEWDEYQDMLAMMRGDRPNTMIVASDFPPELMDAVDDVGGYNAKRKPTMMRILSKRGNTLHMVSLTLDGSNRQALEKIYDYTGSPALPGELLGQRRFLDLDEIDQEFLPDYLRAVYDKSLTEQYGGRWRAGRSIDNRLNTHAFVLQQPDLLAAYLLTTDRFEGGNAEYNLAAAMKQRYLNGESRHNQGINYATAETHAGLSIVAHAIALAEMNGAGLIARRRGEVVSGCGATIGGEAKDDGIESQLKEAGYGGKLDGASNGSSGESEGLVWKDGVCIIDNCPTRPGKTKVAQCSICRLCQGWFDKGKDPAKIYQPKTANFWSIIEFNFGKKNEQDD